MPITVTTCFVLCLDTKTTGLAGEGPPGGTAWEGNRGRGRSAGDVAVKGRGEEGSGGSSLRPGQV